MTAFDDPSAVVCAVEIFFEDQLTAIERAIRSWRHECSLCRQDGARPPQPEAVSIRAAEICLTLSVAGPGLPP
jgi:hypothetical protein